MEELLRVERLVTSFQVDTGRFHAVDDVSFHVHKGQSVGLVGESGSGKSVTSLSVLRLIQSPPGHIESGRVLFNGQDLLALDDADMRKIRGNKISMIFQEPMTSLNPVFTIGDQIGEVFRIHRGLSRAAAHEQAIDMLRLVKIPAPEQRVHEYPHQLSGGMRQRVMIAMALACRPQLLIADEPTTALDVTIQAQILDLMRQLQDEFKMAILLITHDLGVVAEFCDYVLVMYGGRIVEQAPVDVLFKNPQHPYTQGLIRSIPRLGQRVSRLATIEGAVPGLGRFPPGCSFQNRCPQATEPCRLRPPELTTVEHDHAVACWLTRA